MASNRLCYGIALEAGMRKESNGKVLGKLSNIAVRKILSDCVATD